MISRLQETTGLEKMGYRVTFLENENGLVTCILEEKGQQWRAESATRQNALELTFRQAVPSNLARELILHRLQISSKATAAEINPSDRITDPAEAHVDTIDSDRDSEQVDPFTQIIAPPKPEGSQSTVSELEGIPESGPTDSMDSQEPVAIQQPKPKRDPVPAPKSIDPNDAIDRLIDLKKSLQDELQELPQCSPDLIRAHLLLHVSAMWALSERSPDNSTVNELCDEYRRILCEFAEEYWPGTIPALQRDCEPWNLELLIEEENPLEHYRYWSDVHYDCCQLIQRIMAVESTDEFGWSDTDKLLPYPATPNDRLAQVDSELNKMSGTWTGEKGIHKFPEANELNQKSRLALTRLAKMLRWLRGACSSDPLWGKLMGKMRFLESKIPGKKLFQKTLTGGFTPHEKTWAAELNEKPIAKKKRRERSQLIKNSPTKTDDANFHVTWIHRAGEHLDWEEIAALLINSSILEHHPNLLQIADNRKERRNFPKIQKRIESGDSDPEICTRLDKEALETQSNLKAEKAPRPKYSDDQFRFAKTQTKGKRILFVNNRADHYLKTQLELAFEPGELKWCSCDKELENTIRSIETTDYDLILVATGFLGHDSDIRIRKAAKKAGSKYISVNKGRPLACCRAINRDLNKVVA